MIVTKISLTVVAITDTRQLNKKRKLLKADRNFSQRDSL